MEIENAIVCAKLSGASERELVMRVGHSPEASKLIEHLCLNSSTADQAVNEGKILHKLPRLQLGAPACFSWSMGRQACRPHRAARVSIRQGISIWFDAEHCGRVFVQGAHSNCHGTTSHGDITPRNVGVYTRPEDHGGRKYYLYDFGFAVELQAGSGKAVAVNPLFSAAETIESHVVTLATELASVVYLCLYVAGVRLPWEELVHWGPRLACVPRRDFAKSLKDLELPNVTPALRQWMLFVLTQASNAAPEETYRNLASYISNKHKI